MTAETITLRTRFGRRLSAVPQQKLYWKAPVGTGDEGTTL
jgi:hypothetical protein